MQASFNIKYAHCASMTGGETPPLRDPCLTEKSKN